MRIILSLLSSLLRLFFLFSKNRIEAKGIIVFPRFKVAVGNKVRLSSNSVIVRGKYCLEGGENILINEGTVYKSEISIQGHNNKVIISEKCHLVNSKIVVKGNNCSVIISSQTNIGTGCWMVVMGNGKMIKLGNDCMIADNVDLWATDSHPIYILDTNNMKQVINPSESIILGNHVWIGKKAILLKGITIGDNAIVGMGSVITKNIPTGSVAVGNPGRIVKHNVNWERSHINI